MGTFENRVSGDGEPAILAVSAKYTGIWGESQGGGSGVYGRSPGWHGVFGESDSNTGVLGQSTTLYGVHGVSVSSTGSLGQSDSGFGLHGTSLTSTGVVGHSDSGFGVHGKSKSTTAGVGQSETGVGVEDITAPRLAWPSRMPSAPWPRCSKCPMSSVGPVSWPHAS